ncbi:TIGR04552 family protein [Pseudomarimonas salicorniae]|uniref:TIGR04552 family protein n=1 Tax=Pseudomarimonas salicorniae TaxID=2933270 RepID=A0ABT0GE42_9GAMM|nr:TIGR04552 family protein [Lysobacter sp. CAU 1642]MCK7592708.1 TIGR04552 family protein [Lysobacter sp. CAU 1642]
MSGDVEPRLPAAPTPTLGEAPLTLNWQYLRAIARGESAIDLRGMALRHHEDAQRFAREYGLDPENPAHAAWMRRVHREAVVFLRECLLSDEEGRQMPPEVCEPADVLDLLVYASRFSRSRSTRRHWSCAVLKVMHALFYIDSNLKLRHFETIRRQVFAALDTVILRSAEGQVLSDGEIVLPLVAVDRKSAKGRQSILLKLLQKSAYVAEDIHDHLGVRLVLDTRIECLLALRVLQRAQLLSAINIESHRVRNTLIDLDAAHDLFAVWRDRLAAAEGYPREALREMDAALAAATPGSHNPHSGAGFRSLQVTVRKLIHLPPDGEEPAARMEAQPSASVGRAGPSFYFNYEIQLLDRSSYEATRAGPASHGAYKQRQVETARRRVLGELAEPPPAGAG